MNVLKHVLKFGLMLFLVAGCLNPEPGSRFEWVPYALMLLGIAMTLGYLVIDTQFYTGD